jgi:hypothetical protein
MIENLLFPIAGSREAWPGCCFPRFVLLAAGSGSQAAPSSRRQVTALALDFAAAQDRGGSGGPDLVVDLSGSR